MTKFFFIFALAILSFQSFAAPKEKPAPPPPLTYSTPAAALPGRTTRVTFGGAISGQAVGLWTSFPATVSRPADAGKEAVFDLNVGGDVPVGIYAVRLATTAGVSNLQLFMVDDLPSTLQETGDGPQHLALPGAIDGACKSLAVDRYQIDVKKGQRVTFDVVAQRLGSRLDPIIRVTDWAGREVAYCDDTPGLGADIRFAHTFAADGKYLIELRDADYQGGSEFRYRLRVGNFPAATVAFPAGVSAMQRTAFDFAGPDFAGVITRSLALRGKPRMSVALRDEGSDSSGFVSILGLETGDFIAHAPNHTFQSAAAVALPATVAGRFETSGQRDYYQINAKKGDRLAIRGQTRGIASPSDLLLQFFKPDGGKMAESKAVAADEGMLDITIPADGAYRLCAQDLSGGAGPAFVYRVEIERIAPGFSLSVDTDKVDGSAGGTIKFKVKCARREFNGPIELALTGDAAKFELTNQTIAAGKSETDLEIKIPQELPAKLPLTFSVIGRAKVGDADQVQTASTAAVLKTVFPRVTTPLVELDGVMGLGVRAAK